MLQSLQFADLLRYFFSGTIFLAALFATKDGISSLTNKGFNSFAEATGATAAALVLGSLCYAIHRSLYRPIIWLQLRFLKGERNANRTKKGFLDEEFSRDCARWTRLATFPKFQDRLGLWAAHVHFLYCSAWTSLVGAVTGHLLMLHSSKTTSPFSNTDKHIFTFWAIIVFAVLLLAVAAWQDHVLTYYDCRLQDEGVPPELRLPGSDSQRPTTDREPGEY